MAEQIVRSPNTVTRDTSHNRRVDALEHGGPFNPRADSQRRADQSQPGVPPVVGQSPGVVPDRGRGR